MYYLKTFCQFLIFFSLFLITHYWMSREDVFSIVTFTEALPLLLLSSIYMGLLCTLIIQVLFVYHHFLLRLLGLLFVSLQIYFNFSYFEYYIVFKTPLFGKDIIYMKNPSSLWQLAIGSVWNIRFLFFVLFPVILFSLTLFSLPLQQHRKFVFQKPQWFIKLRVWLLIFVIGISSYCYYPKMEKQIQFPDYKLNFGYKRNPLISIYEAVANYLQFDLNYPKPDNLIDVRNIFLDKEKREFLNPEFPLLHRRDLPPHFSNSDGNMKNVIILMMESFPLAEIYSLSKNLKYISNTPFLEQLIPKTLYFPNTYASGLHTFYGFSDVIVGNASYQYLSWNNKIGMKFSYSLPHLLGRNGYQNLAWYYGGYDKNFDQMYHFTEMAGFNHRIFYSSYSNKAKNSNWGKSDRETLMLAARDIMNFKPPFFSFILSLTKHGPWNTPPDFDHEGFKRDFLSHYEGKISSDSLRHSYHLIYYYDQILKEFFTTLERHPNFENSLVIITSDQAFFPDIKGSNTFHTMKNGFNIPLIFYEPGKKTLKPGKSEIFASHLDIIPTLISYLGLNTPQLIPYQGKNLLNPIYHLHPDAYSHVAFWQDDLIQFTRGGFYKLTTDIQYTWGGFLESTSDVSTISKSEVIWIGSDGKEYPSQNEEINQMLHIFKSHYPYLIENNLAFPTSE